MEIVQRNNSKLLSYAQCGGCVGFVNCVSDVRGAAEKNSDLTLSPFLSVKRCDDPLSLSSNLL